MQGPGHCRESTLLGVPYTYCKLILEGAGDLVSRL